MTGVYVAREALRRAVAALSVDDLDAATTLGLLVLAEQELAEARFRLIDVLRDQLQDVPDREGQMPLTEEV